MINIFSKSPDPDAQIFPISSYKDGEMAYCPCCGIRMHIAHSSLGRLYFAAFPGSGHTGKICKRMDRDKKHISFEKITVHSIVLDSMRLPKTGSGGPDTGNGGGGNPGTEKKQETESEKTKLTLQELAAINVHRFGKDYLLGGAPLGAEMLSYRWAREFSDIFATYRGEKIVHAKFKNLEYERQNLWFSVFFRNKAGVQINIPIRVHFFDAERLDSFLDVYCVTTKEKDGTVRHVPKDPGGEFYIAGIWDCFTLQSGKKYLTCVAKSLKQFAPLPLKAPQDRRNPIEGE